jgi:hypothetical protein
VTETARSRQWNVKGVDAQTRIVARDAAGAADLAMGAWIDRAIRRAVAVQTAASPFHPEPDQPARPSSIERAVAQEPEPVAAPIPPAPAAAEREDFPERYPRSAPRDNLGRVALIGIAAGVAALLIGGGTWLFGDRMMPRPIASGPEPAARSVSDPMPAQVGVVNSETTPRTIATDASRPASGPGTTSSEGVARPMDGNDVQARLELAEIQRLLSRLDLDPGSADGVMVSKTEQAIATFQTMAGMVVDGRPSAALLEELREVAGAAKR